MALLERFRRLAYNMNDPDAFGQTTHSSIKGTKFTNTMSSNKYTWNPFDSSIPIGGVSSVQFVSVTNKIQARNVVNIIEEFEVEIAWHSLKSS
jgi:hypothetical protein